MNCVPGVIEEDLDHVHVGVHGPAAVVDHQDDLQPVFQVAIEDDLDLAGVAHGFVDGLVHVDLVPRPRRDHMPETFQGFADLGRR